MSAILPSDILIRPTPPMPPGEVSPATTGQPPLAFSFKTGEIIRGTVVDVGDNGMVRLELPGGVASASVASDNLRRGDVLQFQVRAHEPQFLLRVHSIPVAQNPTDAEDMLRIFGLKQSMLNVQIIRYLREGKSMVGIEDILALQKGIVSMQGQEVRNNSVEGMISVLGKMHEAGIPLEPYFFRLMESFMTASTTVPEMLTTLQQSTPQLTPAMQEVVSTLTGLVSKPFTHLRELLQRFSLPSSENVQPAYSLLQELMRLAEDHPNLQHVQETASRMLESIEGQQLYNVYALHNRGALVFFVLFPVGNNVLPATIEFDTAQQGEHGEAIRSFKISTELSELGTVHTSGYAFGRNLTLSFQADTASHAESIAQYKGELVQRLRAVGYSVQSIRVYHGAEEGGGSQPLHGVNLVV